MKIKKHKNNNNDNNDDGKNNDTFANDSILLSVNGVKGGHDVTIDFGGIRNSEIKQKRRGRGNKSKQEKTDDDTRSESKDNGNDNENENENDNDNNDKSGKDDELRGEGEGEVGLEQRELIRDIPVMSNIGRLETVDESQAIAMQAPNLFQNEYQSNSNNNNDIENVEIENVKMENFDNDSNITTTNNNKNNNKSDVQKSNPFNTSNVVEHGWRAIYNASIPDDSKLTLLEFYLKDIEKGLDGARNVIIQLKNKLQMKQDAKFQQAMQYFNNTNSNSNSNDMTTGNDSIFAPSFFDDSSSGGGRMGYSKLSILLLLLFLCFLLFILQ